MVSRMPTPPTSAMHARQPVWAPNPAVPPVARVLSYLFAILVLLTIIATMAIPRPPDTLPTPSSWQQYTRNSVTIQYPKGWTSQHDDKDQSSQTIFAYGKTAIVIAMLAPSHGVQDQEFLAERDQAFESNMENSFKGYTATTTTDAAVVSHGWHTFSIDSIDGKGGRMLGVWGSRVGASQILYMVAFSRAKDWPTLSGIYANMMDTATL